MGLKRHVVDVRATAERLRPHVEAWLNQAEIVIIDPTLDVRMGSLSDGPSSRTVIRFPTYWGRTRVQPRRAALESRQIVNDTFTRRVDFWLEYPMDDVLPDIRAGHQLYVTDGGNDPYLTNYQYVVTGAINSSMAWQRTVQTNVDLEADPQFDISWAYGTISEDTANLTVQYLGSDLVLHDYYSTPITGGEFRVPLVGAAEYQLIFEDGSLSATVSIEPVMGEDFNVGNVELT